MHISNPSHPSIPTKHIGGESGKPVELLEKYQLTAPHIYSAANIGKVMNRAKAIARENGVTVVNASFQLASDIATFFLAIISS